MRCEGEKERREEKRREKGGTTRVAASREYKSGVEMGGGDRTEERRGIKSAFLKNVVIARHLLQTTFFKIQSSLEYSEGGERRR